MTIHRALGYVDRASVREDAPLTVVLATEGRKGDGIDLRMAGAQLDRFRANPVLGYGHAYWGRANLPIGRVAPDSVSVEGLRLTGSLEFDTGDDFAREVERKMRSGFLNAVSIGFEVTRWEDPKSNYWTGGVAETWELHELSVVPVPMDASAVVESGRGLADPDLLAALRGYTEEEFDRLLARMQRLRSVLAPEVAPVVPEVPAPAVPAVDPEAARNFLAALNLEGHTR